MGLFEYIAGVTLFICCLLTMVSVAVTFADDNAQDNLANLNEGDYNGLPAAESLSFELKDAVYNGSIETESSDYGIVRGSIGVIKKTYKSYDTTKNLTEELQKNAVLPIPDRFFQTFLLLCLLTLTFSIVWLVFRFKG